MKRYLSFLLIAIVAFIKISFVSAQFVGSTENTQTPIQEVRKGANVQYTIPVGVAGDQYSWEIIGGVPTPAASSGTGTALDPYIINFTVGLNSIMVQWGTDALSITGVSGKIRVQKRAGAAGCISLIQSLDITRWSNATATISDADIEMCSGDATPGIITVQLTGAPNFDLKYTVTNLDGSVVADQPITAVTGSSVTIPLPANLVNTSTTVDQTYQVSLTQMNDSFQGDGTVLDGSYIITVHPAVSTGAIIASPAALQRR